MPIRRDADNLVRYPGPIRESAGTVLDQASGAACVARVYDEQKECAVLAAETRLREAFSDGPTVTIPHIVPQWIQAGDTMLMELDSGLWVNFTVDTVTPGTDENTPATNFDTLGITVTKPAGISAVAAIGNRLQLSSKGSSAADQQIPIQVKYNPPARLDEVTLWTTDPATPERDMVVDFIHTTYATEDGEIAVDQDEVQVLSIIGQSISNTLAIGGMIRTEIGADITMAEYGTPVAGAQDWGWEGTFADSMPDLREGSMVRIIITFNEAVLPGFKDTVNLIEPVVDS
jgi:hypothetical protein